MLLSKRKIQIIHKLFKVPYKPTLINILSQNENMAKMSMEIKNSINLSNTIENNSRRYYNKSQQLNIIPKYNNYNKSHIDYSNNYTDNTMSYNTMSYNTISYETNNYPNYYPFRKEIIIKNPEDIIQSGVLKGSIKHNVFSSNICQNQNMNQNEINHELKNIKNSDSKKIEEIKETEKFSEAESVEDKGVKEKEEKEKLEQKEINLLEIESVNSLKKLETKETHEIDNEIQGKLTDTIKLEKENDLAGSINSVSDVES